MSVRRLHPDQPATFDFTQENLAWAEEVIRRYPAGKQASAVIPLLWRAQEQHDNWLPEPASTSVNDAGAGCWNGRRMATPRRGIDPSSARRRSIMYWYSMESGAGRK